MMRGKAKVRFLLAATGVALLAASAGAVDVKVQSDEDFDFKAPQTWAWTADVGEVKMARTKDDNPEAMRKRVEPIIVDAVMTEMPRRGLQLATGTPDVLLTYYLLLTTTASAQTIGQFLPGTVAWGLPPIPAATQSLEIMNQGSLVLDVSAQGRVVWRGVAQAKIKMDSDNKKREALIREAVRDLLRRYPAKK